MMPSDLEPVSGNLTNQTDERSQKNEDIPQLITLGQEYAEAIWTPDIYFPDSVNIERPGKGELSSFLSVFSTYQPILPVNHANFLQNLLFIFSAAPLHVDMMTDATSSVPKFF